VQSRRTVEQHVTITSDFFEDVPNDAVAVLQHFFSALDVLIINSHEFSELVKVPYHKIDFKISEEATVKDAVNRFTAFNIGCLAVSDEQNKVVGVLSERDYINKVASLDKSGLDMRVKDICTFGPSIIIAKKNDSLEACMNKMMFKDIRHLLIIDDKDDEFIGMISIKDLIKEIIQDKSDQITRLSDFKLGKGAFFGSE
jgi:CBS domain-containing protein